MRVEVTPRLFPVTVTVGCPSCGYAQRALTAEDFGGLRWIEDAGARGHAAEHPDCAGKTSTRVVG